MKTVSVKPSEPFKGEIRVPGDKSISHRAILLSALASGESILKGMSHCDDVMRSLGLVESLGLEFSFKENLIAIDGKGFEGLKEPNDVIDAGNSGTTIRLGSGLLSACPFFSILTGDFSLRNRPMDRVIHPLSKMGASIQGRADNRYAPIAISRGKLFGIFYDIPKASAQVKSSLMIAGLNSKGELHLKEPVKTRDHTERLFKKMGVEMELEEDNVIRLKGVNYLKPLKISIPGDFSSAAFFIVGALIKEGSDLTIKDVGLNPLRIGLLHVLREMGGNIEVSLKTGNEGSYEPFGDIRVRSSKLRGIKLHPKVLPSLIDEVPILCIAALVARGKSSITGANELRFKESDRVTAIIRGLLKLGANVKELPDGFIIEGGRHLRSVSIDSFNDHRIAMAFAIAGFLLKDGILIENPDCVKISFPEFWKSLSEFAKLC